MRTSDHFIHLILSAIFIIGVYQFYFFTQKHLWFKTREFRTVLDDWIPYWPWWSYVYSFLYYPAILYVNWAMEDAHQFIMTLFSFVILLWMQMVFFVLFPVKTPDHWRELNQGRSCSEKFLLFVRKFDGATNCFPSMHVSIATLAALHVYPTHGAWVFWFPALIAMSCAFTKQHYLIDLPAGAALGWAAYWCYLLVI